MIFNLRRQRPVGLMALVLLLLLLPWSPVVKAQNNATTPGTTLCREDDFAPHQASTWQNQFPNDLNTLPESYCDGSIEIQDDGSMCVTGRVNYGQLQDASGDDRPIYQLTSREVSVQGHLLGGSGYVWLADQVFYLVDFVTSYTINGTTFQADKTILNNVLAASRGIIEGLCLDPSFRQFESFYKISHKTYLTNSVEVDNLLEGEYTFISRVFTVVEFHTPQSDGPSFLNFGSFSYRFSNFLTNVFGCLTMPTIQDGGFLESVFGIFPTNVFAPVARLLVNGVVSTKNYPVPVTAPNDITEAIQIDTEYRALARAVQNGLFTEETIPLYFYVRFKKVEPRENTVSCFNETAVILEITGPKGDGEDLDEWVDTVVYPALVEAGGTVTLHFGKRIPPNTNLLLAALQRYESCGVELNLDPDVCYHPQCKRSIVPDPFIYPPQYYAFSDAQAVPIPGQSLPTTTVPATTTPSVTPSPATCSAYSICAELELVGDCCPTPDGTMLDCCTSPPPVTCSAHSMCAELEGDCCPTPDGTMLDCCDI